jgi:hypothetical protein
MRISQRRLRRHHREFGAAGVTGDWRCFPAWQRGEKPSVWMSRRRVDCRGFRVVATRPMRDRLIADELRPSRHPVPLGVAHPMAPRYATSCATPPAAGD